MRFCLSNLLTFMMCCIGLGCQDPNPKSHMDVSPVESPSTDYGTESLYPLDDLLKVNHLQALGTHNSYHLASEITILPWRYNHLPLDQQLGQQGIRQFELDIYDEAGTLNVYHIERLDQNTNCETLDESVKIQITSGLKARILKKSIKKKETSKTPTYKGSTSSTGGRSSGGGGGGY